MRDETKTYYDDFATHYDEGRDRGYHALVDELETSIVRRHATGKDALEVGCGTGLILAQTATFARSARGIDLSPGMLEHARRRGLDVQVGDATSLPFADASFDCTYSFKVLAHVPDIGRALAEMARVTRPGGHIIAEFYNRRSLRYLARLAAGARRIGRDHREDDITTRWDDLASAKTLFPSSVEVVDVVGVRVVTPLASLFRVPIVRQGLALAERLAADGPLARYGGFLVLVAKKL